ncbi:alpha/beta fold hydrolase [Nannocystaceae bacterium ST9]
MAEITIADELALHYEFSGDPSGPLLVFVNGLLTDRGSWAAHLPHFSSYRCLTWDCRGQGRSSKPAAPSYPVATHADDLAALLDALAPGEPIAIVGLSNGAAAALDFASARPRRVRSLVLGGAYARVDEALRLKLRSWIAAMRAGGAGLRFDVATPWVWGPRFLAEHAQALAGYRERGLALDLEAAERLIAGAMVHDLDDDRLGRIVAPTLICVGDDDVLTPPSSARAIAEALPVARLEPMPGLGHAAALEDVEGFSRLARRWIDATMLAPS